VAWGGKHPRMTDKQRKRFFRTSNRSLPQCDPERDVLEQLGRERLPPTKEAYQAQYNELMAARKQKE
jgi:hypothetical protein